MNIASEMNTGVLLILRMPWFRGKMGLDRLREAIQPKYRKFLPETVERLKDWKLIQVRAGGVKLTEAGQKMAKKARAGYLIEERKAKKAS